MDAFLSEHKSFFSNHVANYKPHAFKEATAPEPNDDITIAARLRPLLPNEVDDGVVSGISVDETGRTIAVHEIRKKFNGQPAVNTSTFRLDRAYGTEDSSEDVYRDLVVPLVPWAWGGGVSTLFAYGQTGSGKTFTVSALEELAAADIMGGSLSGQRKVQVCVVELEGSGAYDLLNDRRAINVLEDSFGETQLVGAVEHVATDADSLLSILRRGISLRKTEATEKNDTSSRTHAVCRLRITDVTDPSAPDGLLFLVDLAGSEVSADSKHHSKERMKETKEINLSLATLKDCIRGRTLLDSTVSSKKPPHIPWRSSLLTKVLKHVFDPSSPRQCKTAVLACIKPSSSDTAPSKNTLRYADMLRAPAPRSKSMAYKPNEPRTWSNAQLKEWITKNSGDPPIDADKLAPTESGIQMLKMPKGTFVERCAHVEENGKREQIRPELARAFYDKLWRLHIDSRTAKPEAESPSGAAAGGGDELKNAVPWKERIKPGMFVRTPRAGGQYGTGVVMIMAPEVSWKEEGEKRRFVCASVLPTINPDGYELGVAHQMVVGLEEMEDEVKMEWDSAVRYWFMDI
ncbi:P-loop containing nucleoside triphosphate hydrolase protein [Ascodesmis nigricans]|uniref:P-loop containing nucleoside triphosphate hydrolase protein n=1 Tax=Ascodesmis nigricans TaxID=341454 RepID=A0A4V3SIR5_9PEZI|nr:P-loop containing nucleoside triphosphate hydrolase protein [Ascodesmis nigricans]